MSLSVFLLTGCAFQDFASDQTNDFIDIVNKSIKSGALFDDATNGALLKDTKEPQSNEIDEYLFSYNIKDVEEPPVQVAEEFNFKGPVNYGIAADSDNDIIGSVEPETTADTNGVYIMSIGGKNSSKNTETFIVSHNSTDTLCSSIMNSVNSTVRPLQIVPQSKEAFQLIFGNDYSNGMTLDDSIACITAFQNGVLTLNLAYTKMLTPGASVSDGSGFTNSDFSNVNKKDDIHAAYKSYDEKVGKFVVHKLRPVRYKNFNSGGTSSYEQLTYSKLKDRDLHKKDAFKEATANIALYLLDKEATEIKNINKVKLKQVDFAFKAYNSINKKISKSAGITYSEGCFKVAKATKDKLGTKVGTVMQDRADWGDGADNCPKIVGALAAKKQQSNLLIIYNMSSTSTTNKTTISYVAGDKDLFDVKALATDIGSKLEAAKTSDVSAVEIVTKESSDAGLKNMSDALKLNVIEINIGTKNTAEMIFKGDSASFSNKIAEIVAECVGSTVGTLNNSTVPGNNSAAPGN